VANDIQATIMQVYSGGGGGDSSFPESLLARMRVLEALRRGEDVEEEG